MSRWFAAVLAVLWSFLGIRKRNAYLQDANQLKPIHLIVVGLVLAALFVVSLVFFVYWLVSA